MTIRPATTQDAFAIAKVHVTSWRETYSGVVPDRVFEELTYQKSESMHKKLLERESKEKPYFVALNEQKEIVGFVRVGPRRTGPENYEAELHAIYVLEAEQGKGFGKQLFLQAKQTLQELNYKNFLLWVFADNHRSRKFYEAMGGIFLEESTFKIEGKSLLEVSYGWEL